MSAWQSVYDSNRNQRVNVTAPVNDILPPWAEEDRDGRATPYSEAELDDLVEGTVAGIDDTDAWHKLVAEHGEDEARRRLRAALILRDENARRAPRH